MIIINSLGVALFINILNNVKEDFNKVAAFNAYKALSIAKQTSLYIKLGFNRETAREICEIISNETGSKCVFIYDNNDVLYTTCYDELFIKEVIKKFNDSNDSEMIEHQGAYFYIKNLKFNSTNVGLIGLSIKNNYSVDKYYLDFLDELAELLSTQIEIFRLNKIAQNISRAELKALKAQIHPHFLFNALNTIASFCRTNPLKARELILNLSDYFRGTLKRNEDFVKVRDEIDLINSYISIEKARFGDRLNYFYEIDDRILDEKIPSFMLQPIVENSIKHGISPKAVGGSVFLKGSYKEGYLIFIIEDTGVGFDPQDNYIKGEGIGITNIKERLNLYYGENYIFDISSSIEEGTKTIIKIPMLEG
ncbi:sensor histidine kinase [Thermobrachium celere]|uniref:sensor histidine kinase n=1 Tax=Thermobrachium celere TaxID=53422 RepID=UPI001A5F35E5|nr:histidine kinase [Thermobrachium celere]GFR34303.1 hypothetical protein TCEA9_01150 [Thermobrachium celere]